jgi:hypothetical protein
VPGYVAVDRQGVEAALGHGEPMKAFRPDRVGGGHQDAEM